MTEALCIQPTYEELKLIRPLHLLLANFGIQPTYEELKRTTSRCSSLNL